MTWAEVLASDAKEVIVGSYGYTEGRVLSHFEPFRNKREFKFNIIRFKDGDGYLDHKWLILRESENSLDFEHRQDGSIYLDDPELMSN
jgi:hypothetical protein